MKKHKLTQSTYAEYQASLFGACFLSFGLGVFFAGYFEKFALLLIVVGIVLHGWGMYKIHRRNK